MSTTPTWIGAFLDVTPEHHDETLAFWAGVTGYAVSSPRGPHDEFHSLEPATGDVHLKVQRVADGPGGVHLDLYVDDLDAASAAVTALGATQVHRSELGFVVLRSPGGQTFCLVTHRATRPAMPASWPGGGRSVVDQVCLDIPPGAYDEECAFWAAATGRRLGPSSVSPEFQDLERPHGQRVRLLLQRLDDDQPAVTAHLDLACSDRAAETARHESLGATVLAVHARWTVLRDPSGAAYCLTDRDPGSSIHRPDPPYRADEVTTLRGFLDHFRATLRRQVEGLDAAQLDTVLAPSTMTLGGIVEHLAWVEAYWCDEVLLGAQPAARWSHLDFASDGDAEWHDAVHHDPAALDDLFVASVADTDRTLDEALASGGLDQQAAHARHDGQRASLRWILVHLVEEYARHCGHADLIRESLDGATDR